MHPYSPNSPKPSVSQSLMALLSTGLVPYTIHSLSLVYGRLGDRQLGDKMFGWKTFGRHWWDNWATTKTTYSTGFYGMKDFYYITSGSVAIISAVTQNWFTLPSGRSALKVVGINGGEPLKQRALSACWRQLVVAYMSLHDTPCKSASVTATTGKFS